MLLLKEVPVCFVKHQLSITGRKFSDQLYQFYSLNFTIASTGIAAPLSYSTSYQCSVIDVSAGIAFVSSAALAGLSLLPSPVVQWPQIRQHLPIDCSMPSAQPCCHDQHTVGFCCHPVSMIGNLVCSRPRNSNVFT